MGVRLTRGYRGRRRETPADRGMVTAETAIAAVAAVAVFALLLGGIEFIVGNTRASQTAGAAARQVARGDSRESVTANVGRAIPGASVDIRDAGGLTEVRVDAPLTLPFGPRVTVSATSRVRREGAEW